MTAEEIRAATDAQLAQRTEQLFATSYWRDGSDAINAADAEMDLISAEALRRRRLAREGSHDER